MAAAAKASTEAIKSASKKNSKCKKVAKPEIIVHETFDRVTDKGLDALVNYNNPPEIFQRDGSLVKLVKGDKGIYKIINIELNDFKYVLAKSARWVKIVSDSDGGTHPVDVHPVDGVVKAIYQRKVWERIPKLTGLINTPIIRPDGSICFEHGYDERTGYYYVKGLEVPEIPINPTQEDAKIAEAYINLELFSDFPLVGDASKANCLAGLLTPLIRPMLDGGCIPLNIITKPLQGTGASKLVNIYSLVAFGVPAPTLNPNCKLEEWDKLLLSILIEGKPLANLDNVDPKNRLASPSLARFLTSNNYSGRILGKSITVNPENNTALYATGNIITLGGDIPRRCYLTKLDAGTAKPWEREKEFRHKNLDKWTKDNRGKLVVAAITMISAWVQAGRPVPTDKECKSIKPLGSFETWSEIIGGVLAFAGVKGFLDNREELYNEIDEERNEWQNFVYEWFKVQGILLTLPKPSDICVTSKQLLRYIRSYPDLLESVPTELEEAVAKGSAKSLGKQLAKLKDAPFLNGYVIRTKIDTHSKATIYWVEEIKKN